MYELILQTIIMFTAIALAMAEYFKLRQLHKD